MAMLAERRMKKRYNLVPRGKALYEDDSRLGTRLLEKMGWSKGKGLGAKEDGNKDFIRIRYKHDSEGLGFEDRNDQWTQHELQFDGLLKTLSNGDDAKENGHEEEERDIEMTPTVGFGFKQTEETEDPLKIVKISGESLEEKSKTSRVRVHYQKFTRGKDISRYSEKDLANIFGRKNLVPVVNGQIPAVEVNDKNNSSSSSQPEYDNVGKTKEHGVVTMSSGTSINDYFKLKMEAFRNKCMGGQQFTANDHNAPTDLEVDGVVNADDGESLPRKSHKKSLKRKHRSDAENATEDPENMENDGKVKKKSKKSKKSTETYCDEQNGNNSVEDVTEVKSSKKKSKKGRLEVPAQETVDPQPEPKKSKKSKQLNEMPTQFEIQNSICDVNEETPIKKKRKSKRKQDEVEENSIEESKKKRIDCGSLSLQNDLVLFAGEPDLASLSKSDKKPEFKSPDESFIEQESLQMVLEETSEQDSKPKEKKSKKNKSLENTLDNTTEGNATEECATVSDQNVSGERKKNKKSKKEKDTEQHEEANISESPAVENVKKSKKSKRQDMDENINNELTPASAATNLTTQIQQVHANSISSQSPQSTTPITDNKFRFPELIRRNQRKKHKTAISQNDIKVEPGSNSKQTTFVMDTNSMTTTDADAEYKIEMNEFVAVKFSNVDFEGFPGSNLSDIAGYSITGGRVKIEIKHRKVDAMQIEKYYDLADKRGKDFNKWRQKEKLKTTVFPHIVKEK